jgi:hypothetical protein
MVQLGLVLTFGLSAILKLYDRMDFLFQLGKIGLVGFGGAVVLSYAVPAVELMVAFCLFVKPRIGALMAAILLMSFTSVLIYAQPPDGCGCFGKVLDFGLWGALVRNFVLLGAVGVVYANSKKR